MFVNEMFFMEIYVFDLDIWIYLDDLSYQFGLKLDRDKKGYAKYTDKSEKKFKWKKEMCCSVFQLASVDDFKTGSNQF